MEIRLGAVYALRVGTQLLIKCWVCTLQTLGQTGWGSNCSRKANTDLCTDVLTLHTTYTYNDEHIQIPYITVCLKFREVISKVV